MNPKPILGFLKGFFNVLGHFLAFLLLTQLAIMLFLGGIGVFHLNSTSNWNAIPLFIGSGLVFAAIIWWIKRLRKRTNAKKWTKKTWFKIITSFSLVFFVIAVLTDNQHHQFRSVTQGLEFNRASWVFKENTADIADFFIFWNKSPKRTEKEEALFVIDYFDKLNREKNLVRKWERNGVLNNEELQEIEMLSKYRNRHQREIENILSNQVETILYEEGLANPANSWQKVFVVLPLTAIDYAQELPLGPSKLIGKITPVNFRLENKLNILIIAHRDRLEQYKRIKLTPDLNPNIIQKIETAIDKMGFSTIILGTAGGATYPTTVVPGSLHGTIETVAHEWVHNYINFQKLGKADRTNQRNIIEETTASIIDEEIRDKVWERYYAPYKDAPPPRDSRQDDRINFNEAMREIRQEVERLLGEGKVEEAEKYMRERRDWLETEGHYVRKLNQAYFTFRSFYATNPAFQDANDGIGTKLLELREKASSLKEFLDIVSNIENLEDLEKALEKINSAKTAEF